MGDGVYIVVTQPGHDRSHGRGTGGAPRAVGKESELLSSIDAVLTRQVRTQNGNSLPLLPVAAPAAINPLVMPASATQQ